LPNRFSVANGGIGKARLWFPCIDDLMEKCSFEITVGLPAKFVAIASGKLEKHVSGKTKIPKIKIKIKKFLVSPTFRNIFNFYFEN